MTSLSAASSPSLLISHSLARIVLLWLAVTLGLLLPAAAEQLAEEKATYDVVLTEIGPSKIAVIKAVRDAVAGRGRAEARAMVCR